jgi:hypothetical protein
LYRSFKLYSSHDDGFLGEIYSDFVVKTLANKWESLDELSALMANDKSFSAFVLHHVDATTDPKDLVAIKGNAKDRCQPGYESLCQAILRAANAALKYQSKIIKH